MVILFAVVIAWEGCASARGKGSGVLVERDLRARFPRRTQNEARPEVALHQRGYDRQAIAVPHSLPAGYSPVCAGCGLRFSSSSSARSSFTPGFAAVRSLSP